MDPTDMATNMDMDTVTESIINQSNDLRLSLGFHLIRTKSERPSIYIVSMISGIEINSPTIQIHPAIDYFQIPHTIYINAIHYIPKPSSTTKLTILNELANIPIV